MTEQEHLEISRKLARAIGWKPEQIRTFRMGYGENPEKWLACNGKEFDYRDWNVIGPIAERYDCFPYKNCSGLWEVYCSNAEGTATPQEAIALAVIGLVESEKPNAKLSGAEGVRS